MDNIKVVLDSLQIPHYPIKYLNILLPIGLSFHTFQAMSYTIEVFRNKTLPEKHLGYFALYVMYYPQLVAGPIERPQNILPQLHTSHIYDHSKMISGLRLMLWGLFIKVVIADRFGAMTDTVYNDLTGYTGLAYIVATFCFGIQIYCDFAGYSYIAIGASRTMGIDLMTNFNQPYFSATISEFWRRWHISLSTWFRDYVYIPLGGNRKSPLRTNINLMVVFLLSGFWHGASWNFVIWGALHGSYLVIGNFMHSIFPFFTKKNILNIIVTFILVQVAWVFFRAESFQDSIQVIRHFFALHSSGGYFNIAHDDLKGNITFMGLAKWKFVLTIALLSILFIVDYCREKKNLMVWLDHQSFPVKWAVYIALIVSILCFGYFDTDQFIYFQF